VDGAAVVLLASDDYVKAHGVKPRARILATATYGAEPVIMLTAPAPASERALEKAGMSASDIDLWEINEAFAVVVLAIQRRQQLPLERINVFGGAIALGHPIGASGARILVTLLNALEILDRKVGLASLCVGGGEAVGMVVERLPASRI
jgi:acetyl-CoA C-acetyltransferase